MAKPAMRKTQLLVFTRAEQRAIVILVANSPLRRPREAKMAYVASKAPLSSQIPEGSRRNIKRTLNSPTASTLG
jgi:hypothetical protein